TTNEASAVSHRSNCRTPGTCSDCPSVIGPPIRAQTSLGDSCYVIEESDQVLPNQVINDQHRRKHQGRVQIMNLHHTEVDEAVAGCPQEPEATSEEESQGREDERKNRSMDSERQVRSRAGSQMQHVPQAE